VHRCRPSTAAPRFSPLVAVPRKQSLEKQGDAPVAQHIPKVWVVAHWFRERKWRTAASGARGLDKGEPHDRRDDDGTTNRRRNGRKMSGSPITSRVNGYVTSLVYLMSTHFSSVQTASIFLSSFRGHIEGSRGARPVEQERGGDDTQPRWMKETDLPGKLLAKEMTSVQQVLVTK
jgi:hypothetical protein